MELAPLLLQGSNVPNRHPHEPRRDSGELLLLSAEFTAGAAAGAGHEGLVVAQAHSHEAELAVVLQVAHEAVGPLLRFHVHAHEPAVAIVLVVH